MYAHGIQYHYDYICCKRTIILSVFPLEMKDSTDNRIRIKDIALRAGVSPGTVDRVLHNRGEVALKTRRQILNIVNELNYTPNILAKSLASKKVYTIAALIPSGKENIYWEKPRFGIEQASVEIKDYNTKVLLFTYDPNAPESLRINFRKALENHPDGIVLAPLAYNSSLEIISECDARVLRRCRKYSVCIYRCQS